MHITFYFYPVSFLHYYPRMLVTQFSKAGPRSTNATGQNKCHKHVWHTLVHRDYMARIWRSTSMPLNVFCFYNGPCRLMGKRGSWVAIVFQAVGEYVSSVEQYTFSLCFRCPWSSQNGRSYSLRRCMMGCNACRCPNPSMHMLGSLRPGNIFVSLNACMTQYQTVP